MPLGNRTVLVAVWHVRVGRVKLYLLDTDLEENAPWDRELSARLYGGDRETRVQQEIILGIGGVRALKALGIDAVGLSPERRPRRVRRAAAHPRPLRTGWSFDAALEEVRRTTVFTTHTPVPAGHDAFPFHLVETHLAGCWGDLGGYRERFLALGGYDNGGGAMFNMTALALRTAAAVNGVSQLHGEVTEQMWEPIWPGVADDEAARSASITNGVHVPTWLSSEIGDAVRRYLGADWRDRHDDPALWRRVLDIPDEELWAARQRCGASSSRSSASARASAGRRSTSAPRASSPPARCSIPNALTIGFARRFTSYKRPELIFRDPDRLARILNAQRPPRAVRLRRQGPSRRRRRQASPAARLQARARSAVRRPHRLRRRLRSARRPLPGPGLRRLAEQPAQAARSQRHQRHEGGDQRHAAPLDRRRLVGRRLHRRQRLADRRQRRRPDDHDAQDWADAEAIYALLEHQIVPTFYDRDEKDIPRRWLHVVKQSIRTVLPRFSARRMVKEYVRGMYSPAMRSKRYKVNPKTQIPNRFGISR